MLQLRTAEVTQERDQLRTNLMDLQQQVALLMAEWERDRMSRETSLSGEVEVESGMSGAVGLYMEVQGNTFSSDRECVFEIGTQLWGEVANWLVRLMEEDWPEIYNLECFLLALRQRFEDPFGRGEGQGELQHLRQGNLHCGVSLWSFGDWRATCAGGSRWSSSSYSGMHSTPRSYSGP
uniref:Uncharacterized protein n=1 Tax=Sphaerodactylus townsendi TaxID=933632 RepID=A0ACB8FCA6_9SAUR